VFVFPIRRPAAKTDPFNPASWILVHVEFFYPQELNSILVRNSLQETEAVFPGTENGVHNLLFGESHALCAFFSVSVSVYLFIRNGLIGLSLINRYRF
jgi:hypothetical protein